MCVVVVGKEGVGVGRCEVGRLFFLPVGGACLRITEVSMPDGRKKNKNNMETWRRPWYIA